MVGWEVVAGKAGDKSPKLSPLLKGTSIKRQVGSDEANIKVVLTCKSEQIFLLDGTLSQNSLLIGYKISFLSCQLEIFVTVSVKMRSVR